MKKNNNKGFTLIELLVVIAIIGLLSTLAVVALNSARQKARDSKRIADIKQIQTALELYYNDAVPNGYPTGTNVTLGPAAYSQLCASGWATNTACTGTVYMGIVPNAPTPADTGCTTDGGDADTIVDNLYAYNQVSSTSYTLGFCLGGQTGGLAAGKHQGTEAGMQ
jgi:general secretion pathway protein G